MKTNSFFTWLVFSVVALLLASCGGVQPLASVSYWPTEGWQSSTPEAQGISSARLAEALLTMRQQEIDIHSLLLIRHGQVVADADFYPYDGLTVHDLASVTKSVMTTLIAIAADQDKLNLDEPLVSFFPERIIANRDAFKERITVRHLASMTSGLDCTSERDEETLQQMLVSEDWVQFTLDRQAAWEPGTHFVYCSPGMHLLSAILQQATGQTALDFARQNLFEPLGIHDVIWPTDPQGFNHGWGDLRLHPHDMAKLGYLWLNQGIWDGRQIVSRDWVTNSVKAHSIVEGDGDDYGYGWWIPRDVAGAYSAQGRGGQYIIVVPAWKLIVVTTGGGFEFDEIEPLVVAALVDMDKMLPADPDGVTRLEAAQTTIAQPPSPDRVAPLPAIAETISGQIFVFEPNPAGIETLSLEFDDSAEAILHLTRTNSSQPVSWPIGLDGVYRMSAGDYDLPQGLRGAWADDRTFVFEYDNIANNDHATYRLRFEGDRLVVEGQETAHELGATFEGRLKTP